MKERDVLRQILDYLAAKRIFAFRLNTGQFFDHGRRFQSHSLGRGAADILALPQGSVPVWIECKSPQGRLRRSQSQFAAMVMLWGHKHVVARSIDDLKGIGL